MAKARTFSSGKSQSSNFKAICSREGRGREEREGRREEGKEEGGRREGGRRKEKGGGRRRKEGERREGGRRREGGGREEGGRKEGGGRKEVKELEEGSTTVWEAVPQQGKLVLQRPAGPRESRPQDSHRDCPNSPSVCTPEQPG